MEKRCYRRKIPTSTFQNLVESVESLKGDQLHLNAHKFRYDVYRCTIRDHIHFVFVRYVAGVTCPEVHPCAFQNPCIQQFYSILFRHLFLTSSPPPTSGHLWCLPFAASTLPFSILIISCCWEERGVVIKEPDWSVNSAQCCMKCTRPSDGPNRASYCKQHAHLDSNKPRGRKRRKLALIKKGSILIMVCVCPCAKIYFYILLYIHVDTHEYK